MKMIGSVEDGECVMIDSGADFRVLIYMKSDILKVICATMPVRVA
jgi:mannose-6-phosphate isomerase-like protein (cupin superfamily)